MSHSCDCMKSYTIDTVVFQGRKSSIGINYSTDDLKDPPTPQKGATISVIRGITTAFLFSNINKNHPSAKRST